MPKAKEFGNRYVLGEGYPWALGEKSDLCKEICLLKNVMISSGFIKLNFPPELWSAHIPKYRLVLEKIEGE